MAGQFQINFFSNGDCLRAMVNPLKFECQRFFDDVVKFSYGAARLGTGNAYFKRADNFRAAGGVGVHQVAYEKIENSTVLEGQRFVALAGDGDGVTESV